MSKAVALPTPQYRFSGHETFPCRYAWLPKAVQHLSRNHLLFSDEEKAMVALGVGKNMVRAIKFWAEASGVVAAINPEGLQVTPFGNDVLGREGYDPYLERIQTLWLLHWKIASNATQPLFAWHYLLNSWHRPEFTKSEIMQALAQEADRMGKKLSEVTLEHHLTTFLHTYTATKSKKNEVVEDNLDCPLVELELIVKSGERTTSDSNRREPVYAFRLEEKHEVSQPLFVYCLNDFWNCRKAHEKTLNFRDVSVSEGSPGQMFKLPEVAVRERLEHIKKDSRGVFDYQESAALQQIVRLKNVSEEHLLENIYGKDY
jgi:hypothetical protein